jgi:HEAT repeat protein
MIGDVRAVEKLVDTLKDSSGLVRSAVAGALGEIKDLRAMDALVARLNDSDTLVRKSSAEALGKMKNNRAVKTLIAALGDADAEVCQYVMDALVRIGSPLVVDRLIDTLGQSRGQVRRNSVEVLGRIGLEHNVHQLRLALNESDERIRQGAAEALAIVAEKRWELLLGEKMNQESPPEELNVTESPSRPEEDILAKMKKAGSRASADDMQTISKLREDLNDSSIEVQIAAISGLGKIMDDMPDVVEDLKKTLSETQSEVVKLKIMGELAKQKDPDALMEIKKYVESEDPVERVYAAQVLGQTHEEGVPRELVVALEDDDKLVRVHAAAAVVRILQNQAAEPSEAEPPRERSPGSSG